MNLTIWRLALTGLLLCATAANAATNRNFEFFYNSEKAIAYLKKQGIKPADLLYLLEPGKYETAKRFSRKSKTNLSHVSSIYLYGDIEQELSTIAIITMSKVTSDLEVLIRKKSKKRIAGIPAMLVGKDKEVYAALVNKQIFIGNEIWLSDALRKAPTSIPRAAKAPIVHLRIDAAKFMQEKMREGLMKGEQFSQGLGDNVFLKSLLKIESLNLSMQLKPNRVSLEVEAKDKLSGERLMMVSHTAIVSSSLALSFMDMLGRATGKQTMKTSDKEMKALQKVFGRIRTKQRKKGVLISLNFTKKETGKMVKGIKKAISAGKKAVKERKKTQNLKRLVAAAQKGKIKRVTALLDDNVNSVSEKAFTPLTAAISGGSVEVVTFLIDKGAEVDLPDGKNRYPIVLAYESENKSLFKLLLSKKASLGVQTTEKKTFLHLAAASKDHGLMKDLIQVGVPINVQDDVGNTPLHYAAQEDDLKGAKLLLEGKAQKDIENAAAQTPADLATSEELKKLLKAGQ